MMDDEIGGDSFVLFFCLFVREAYYGPSAQCALVIPLMRDPVAGSWQLLVTGFHSEVYSNS